jgi:hypothetical protein
MFSSLLPAVPAGEPMVRSRIAAAARTKLQLMEWVPLTGGFQPHSYRVMTGVVCLRCLVSLLSLAIQQRNELSISRLG